MSFVRFRAPLHPIDQALIGMAISNPYCSSVCSISGINNALWQPNAIPPAAWALGRNGLNKNIMSINNFILVIIVINTPSVFLTAK